MAAMNEARRPVALVTGARRGIGRGIALALAARGFDLVVNDREADAAGEETSQALHAAGTSAAFVAHDVSDVDGHEEFVARAWDAFGAIDCLVNNAGVQVSRRGDLLDETPGEFDRLMSVNLRGPYFLTIAVAKRMLAAPTPRHRAIVNVASVNSTMVSTNRGPYCLSKTAVSMMTQLFALRLSPHGIMVNEVRPGIIRTDMTRDVADKYQALIEGGISPVRRWGTPADIGAAVTLLASGEMPFVTGESLYVDGGLHIHDF
jgi:NAD(P)-dependent dehydrogenase (short-subunit alcohol dehydrogenase family)